MHPTIAGMMQDYNKKVSGLCIRNVCKLEGVNIYGLTSVKAFEGENRQLHTCNIFTLKQCSNKICKMAHLLTIDTDKAYPEQLVKMLITGVAAEVTKHEGGKMG